MQILIGFLEDCIRNSSFLSYPPKYTLACILRCEEEKKYKLTHKDFSEGDKDEEMSAVIEQYKSSKEFSDFFGEK